MSLREVLLAGWRNIDSAGSPERHKRRGPALRFSLLTGRQYSLSTVPSVTVCLGGGRWHWMQSPFFLPVRLGILITPPVFCLHAAAERAIACAAWKPGCRAAAARHPRGQLHQHALPRIRLVGAQPHLDAPT